MKSQRSAETLQLKQPRRRRRLYQHFSNIKASVNTLCTNKLRYQLQVNSNPRLQREESTVGYGNTTWKIRDLLEEIYEAAK